jgi:outer membrane protein assembly factor BamB
MTNLYPSEGDLLEKMKKFTFQDSRPDFDNFWNSVVNKIHLKEDTMSEKRGGVKVLVWLFAFLLIVGVSWIGLTKFSQIKKQEKMEKGEAIVVTLVVGDVQVKKMGASDFRKVFVEDILQMGDSIKTGKDSYCELQMIKRGIFRIENSSELYLAKLVNADDKINAKLKLEKGGIALKPNKLKEGENFEVETGTAVAAVRGTKFSVDVDESGNTKIAVNEGKVAVEPVIKSIQEAKDKGQMDQNASDVLKKEIIKPIEVSPGQQAVMETSKVEALDKAIGKAIDKVAEQEGGKITAENLVKPEDKQSTAEPSKETIEKQSAMFTRVSADIIAKVNEAAPVSAGNEAARKDDALTASIVQTEKISEESKKKLDSLNENNIIDKAVDMVKVRFDSRPSVAEIFVDNVSVGFTPMEKIIEKGKKISVKIVKIGFSDFSNDLEVLPGSSMNPELIMVKAEESNTNAPAISKIPGNLEWEKPVAFKVGKIDSEVALYKGRIFASYNNRLALLSTEGDVLKSITVAGEDYKITRPSASDGLVYVGCDNGGLYAYDASTGELAWKKDAGSAKYGAAPTAGYGIVAAPSIDKGIKIYSRSGKSIANLEISSAIYSAPLLINEGKALVYATENGEITCYDIEKKQKKWSKNYGERFVYPLVGNDTIITLARTTGKVMGFNPEDGSIKWETTFAELQRTKINPQYFSGKVILASSAKESTIVVLNANKGSLISKWQIAGTISAPYLEGEFAYIGSTSGKLYSFNLSQKAPVWTYETEKGFSFVAADENGVYAVYPGSLLKIIR